MNKTDKRKALAQALLSLKTEDECLAFLKDICTIKEMDDLANRLQIAGLLNEGKTFNEVEAACKASSVTVSRVNRCLKYGRGYKLIFKRKKEQGGEHEAD